MIPAGRGLFEPVRSTHGRDRPRGRPHIAERVPSAYADVILPVGQKPGQPVRETPGIEVAAVLIQLIVSRVGPLDVGDDASVLGRESVLYLPQCDVIRLLRR